jgi:hypothetical protein
MAQQMITILYRDAATIKASAARRLKNAPKTYTVTASTRFEVDESGGVWVIDGSCAERIGYASAPIIWTKADLNG